VVVVAVVRAVLGKWGEDLAVQHLEAAGYEVLSRNWRCREGEIDVVARAGSVLCFVEVKTRSGLAFGEPAEAVSWQKANRIRKLAGRWLAEHRPPGWSDLRFDVVAVVRAPEGPRVTHLEGAF
jgi:putative endonuclease